MFLLSNEKEEKSNEQSAVLKSRFTLNYFRWVAVWMAQYKRNI